MCERDRFACQNANKASVCNLQFHKLSGGQTPVGEALCPFKLHHFYKEDLFSVN